MPCGNRAGWPLLFHLETEAGVAAYAILTDGAEPQLLLPTNWGPYWPPRGSRLAVGLNTSADSQKQAQLFFFSVIKELWP